MMPTDNTCGQSTRIGLMSRIDFPSDGYRQALLEQAAETFRREDVHFVVLAGGLIAARYVKEKTLKLKKRISQINKLIKQIQKDEKAQAKEAAQAPAKKPAARKSRKASGSRRSKKDEAPVSVGSMSIELLEAAAARFQSYLDEFSADRMAERLAKSIPVFTNAKGEKVKLYIFPSPAYDGEIGESVAQLLAELRSEDVRVYQSGGDRLPIKQAGKVVEVLVPEKSVWMRGDYFSTPVERVLKDKRRQSSRELPDLHVIGCFGATITKSSGELPRPYVTVPVLHRLQEVRVNENQIGVRVMSVHRDRIDPVVRSFSFKDYVRLERSYIELPKSLTPRQLKLLTLLKEHGRMSAGLLSDLAKLSRETVEAELKPLTNQGGKQPKNWPGLRFDSQSKRWDFDGYWVRDHLRYPVLTQERLVDSIVAFGCLHAGSIRTDIQYFLEAVPRAVLERDAQMLIGAGDLVEGYKYLDEIYAAMNVTRQEILAGELIAQVILKVFRARFHAALDKLPSGTVTSDQALRAVEQSLVTFVLIPGNHDLFVVKDGHTPLVVLKDAIIKLVCEKVANELNAKGYNVPGLIGLVSGKIVEPDKGEFDLPSGLHVSIMHPHMSRAKTTSLRPQEMLEKASESHLVVGANFHVGEHLEMWDAHLGQRVCLQLGTIKRGSNFEDNKLKTVDHGFGFIRVESAGKRVVATEATFYSAEPVEGTLIDPNKPFNDLIALVRGSSK